MPLQYGILLDPNAESQSGNGIIGAQNMVEGVLMFHCLCVG
jgi:hypothetical protein